MNPPDNPRHDPRNIPRNHHPNDAPDHPASRPSARRPRPATTGVLVLDKPLKLSSMQAISVVRGKAGGAKVGHAGTLDPLATGVLVVALGKATKIIPQLMNTSKRYLTTVDLSAFTTTADREGEREEVVVDPPPTWEQVQHAVQTFRGEIEQQPPAFSAMKIRGKRAYELARKGEEVDIPSRRVIVHDVELISYDWPLAEVELHTGKGFYVRSFARDLGGQLGTGGHCATLRRTAVGGFTEDLATTLNDVPEPLTEAHLMSIETALQVAQDERLVPIDSIQEEDEEGP